MGNFGCSCSPLSREEFIFDTFSENNPQKPQASEYLSCIQNPCHVESKTTESTDRPFSEVSGELFRLQRSITETLVPRWCVLDSKTFRYFKNAFSARCNDLPLFELPVGKIICGRVYSKDEKFCIEISFFKESATVAAWRENRRPLSEVMNVKDFRNLSLESFKSIKSHECDNRIEVLVFVASDKEEWIRWSSGLMECIKSYLN
jgi:hypothetical protein